MAEAERWLALNVAEEREPAPARGLSDETLARLWPPPYLS